MHIVTCASTHSMCVEISSTACLISTFLQHIRHHRYQNLRQKPNPARNPNLKPLQVRGCGRVADLLESEVTAGGAGGGGRLRKRGGQLAAGGARRRWAIWARRSAVERRRCRLAGQRGGHGRGSGAS